MSALPPKAKVCGAIADVRFGPKADITFLFDHLIGAGEQRDGYLYPDRLGGLEIYD
jgi:hypothetical protein